MTLTHTQKTKAAKPGMTLIELTVVILVLLSLISILFVGARAWKRGSDRAASILEIRNVQQAVRSFQNINNYNPGDAGVIGAADIFGPDAFIAVNPTTEGHPAGTAYSYAIAAPTDCPALSTLYMTVTGGLDASYYMPADITGW
ncbi:MAG: prepilin-type N-terminal cleavage/methylation domain-containing protein [Akkermansiaceae bacterium]|nr:prepilin-type N-terminal cleavage/methylation domain-containing protein [Akkermansiaceae bacterium]NNM28378.1 prepilin-type N-terminal cleavage/methylation domain-containing protein [Akkermansiaceae bacterium]